MGAPREEQPGLAGIRSAASAPAKCILLGEHAVVYGEPCLSVALARRTRVVAHRVGDAFTVDGFPLRKHHHAFIMGALRQVWPSGDGRPEPGDAVRFEVESEVPSAAGIGSSAALSVAAVGALQSLKGRFEPGDVAQQAFLAERWAQGSGSPNDTSVSAAGGCVLLAPRQLRSGGLDPLWDVGLEEKKWFVHRAPAPRFGRDVHWVVGHTGVHAVTRKQVEKVARFVKKSGFARETVRSLGGLVWEGLDALREEDPDSFGRIMDRAHGELVTLGVSHPSLERLVESARRTPGTLGAKLTGAGGGGAMVVLTRQPEQATRVLKEAGASSVFELEPTTEGARPEPEPDQDGLESGAETLSLKVSGTRAFGLPGRSVLGGGAA